ncbi:MAG: hypothetical protein LBQ22_05340 [Bacteroidales bacterium]|jgi:hypothetical protein|nr:hypothetical protein [Bacteroidales bacterium]
MIEIDNEKNLRKIQEVREELVRQSKVAQRLKDSQYSEENLSTVEKIYKYAADHMGTLGCACEKQNFDDHLHKRLNELKNIDNEAKYEASKEVLPLDLKTCINNCDALTNELKEKKNS